MCIRDSWDTAAWLGAALALGVAAWPVVWLWLSLLGGRWSGVALWVVVAVGWLGVAALVARRWLTSKSGLPTRATTPVSYTHLQPVVGRRSQPHTARGSPRPRAMSTFAPASVAPSTSEAKAVDWLTVTAGRASLPPMMLFTA